MHITLTVLGDNYIMELIYMVPYNQQERILWEILIILHVPLLLMIILVAALPITVMIKMMIMMTTLQLLITVLPILMVMITIVLLIGPFIMLVVKVFLMLKMNLDHPALLLWTAVHLVSFYLCFKMSLPRSSLPQF